jgi:hypothetical protein
LAGKNRQDDKVRVAIYRQRLSLTVTGLNFSIHCECWSDDRRLASGGFPLVMALELSPPFWKAAGES